MNIHSFASLRDLPGKKCVLILFTLSSNKKNVNEVLFSFSFSSASGARRAHVAPVGAFDVDVQRVWVSAG